MVARIVQSYISHRAELLHGDSGHSKRVPLEELFEFVESPLQQMKRAGLGLLSKGLGRYINLWSLIILFTIHTLQLRTMLYATCCITPPDRLV